MAPRSLRDERVAAGQEADYQQRHDVDDLDHRVDGRAGGVLVGVADGVAGYRRLMGVGTLAAEVAVLDVLLRVIPGAAAGGHRDSDEEAGDYRADEHAADRLRAEDEADDYRGEHGEQGRDHHLPDGGLGDDVDRGCVVRLAGAFHYALDLTELPPDLVDYLAARLSDGLHRDCAEEVREEAAY